MINFFRTIRKNLFAGNPPQQVDGAGRYHTSTSPVGRYIAYATGEIVLVMIGILLALQVNNWNEDRKERREEFLALKSLHSEFVQSRDQFHRGQSHSKMIFDGMQYLLELLDANRANEQMVDSIFMALDRSSWSSGVFEPSRGIVNSLINSGKLNIISNDNLKTHLIQWNDQVINYQNAQRLAQDYKFTYLFPLISGMTRLPSKIRRTDPGYEWSAASHGGVDFNLLRSSVFYNYLNQCWVYSGLILVKDNSNSRGKSLQQALDSMILLIEKELEK